MPTLILGTINGLNGASSWQNTQIQASRVIVNIKKAPALMIERDLDTDPLLVSSLLRQVAFARQNNLNLFASPSTVDRYLRAGLPYDANSLMTTIVGPRDGAIVRGMVGLIAAAQSDFGVMKVDFEIAAQSGGPPMGVSAVNTKYGWLAEWHSARSAHRAVHDPKRCL